MDSVKEVVKKVCQALNKHDVDYIVIGGWAVIYHGYPRATADIDFLYRPTIENFHKLIVALEDLGIESYELRSVVFDKHKTFLRLPLEIKTGFLPEIPGVNSYADAKKNSVYASLEGVKFYVIGLEDLIKNKRSLNRLKDQNDIEELMKRNFK